MYSPYETLSLRRVNMGKIDKILREMVITNQVKDIDVEGKFEFDNFVIKGIGEEFHDLPFFYQPYTIVLPQRKTTIVVDLRPYNGTSVKDGIIHRMAGNETVNQLLCHAISIGYWREDPQQFITNQDLPLNTYGSLVAETISRRLGLDPEATLKVMAAFQFFYITRSVIDPINLNDDDIRIYATMISRKMKVDLSTHYDVAKQFEPADFKDLETFMSKLRMLAWSPRLAKLSAGDLVIMLAGGWMGQGNPKETMMVALEFPPCWLSLNFICAKNKFYQKLPLGQVLKRLDRSNVLQSFVNTNMVNYFGRVYE